MKFRQKVTGEIKTLQIERQMTVCLANPRKPTDCFWRGDDDSFLEVVEATPAERRALRRAGFHIKPAESGRASFD